MMTSQERSALDAVCLAAQTILECSGEIYRAEETATRMCGAFGFQGADILCFPTGFMLTVPLSGGETFSRTLRVRDRSIRLETLDQVNSVSRQAACGQLSAEGALDALRALRAAPDYPAPILVLAFAASAGFFSMMFGGSPRELVCAFLAGGITQLLLPTLRRLHAPILLTSLVGGTLAAGIALMMVRLLGGSQEAALSGAIMPLLPGLAMTNAVRDTMRGDLIAGIARSTEALLSSVLIAAGVAIVLML
ncbi:MAG: threonine/serine exporter family protein [Christensenellales bacterium]